MPLLTTAGVVAGDGGGMLGSVAMFMLFGGAALALLTHKAVGGWLTRHASAVRGHFYGPRPTPTPPPAQHGPQTPGASPDPEDDFDYSIYDSG